jgi:hypothetical protein
MKHCITEAEKLSENDPVYSKHVVMARWVYDETNESIIKLTSQNRTTK